jgi:hypothetical protein
MGDAYLYLIKNFVDAANQKAGSFCTPRRLVLLKVAIADPQEGEMVYGPAWWHRRDMPCAASMWCWPIRPRGRGLCRLFRSGGLCGGG